MEEIILNAIERPIQPGKFREAGFIPGVLYGDSITKSTLVKFKELDLKKIINKHGANAKVWVKYGDNKKFGYIKEVQKHPVTWKIIHVDIQIVSRDHEVKIQLPINFMGEDNLILRQLKIQILKPEIDVIGKMGLMPDSVDIDVSEKQLGDHITSNDFKLDKQIKVSDKEDEIYATVAHLQDHINAEPEKSETEE